METLAQLQAWQKQSVGHEKSTADMGVSLRLLRHGIEAIAKIEKLRADLAERDRTVNRLTEAILHHKESVFGLHTLNVQACDRKLYAEIEQPLKGKGEK